MALEKLAYCDATLAQVKERAPLVTASDLDEDVSEMAHSLDEFYGTDTATASDLPPRLDAGLRFYFRPP